MVQLSDCPEELNFLAPFLQRANEMAESQPVMAYYCKFYSVSLALKDGPNKFKRTTQTDAFLAKLFDDLETEKNKLSSHSAIKDLTQGAIYVRELAYRVFLSAEKQESSPLTLKKAPQSYMAAINFLQVYRGVFLEDPSALDLSEEERVDELSQIDEKSKYAKWRIIEIKRQLINVSTSEIASSPSVTAATTRNISNLPMSYKSPSTSSPQMPSMNPQAESPSKTINQTAQYHQPILPSVQQVSSPPALLYDPKILADCEKHARHAISALNFDDVETAADNLRAALKVLQPYLKEENK